MRWQDLVKILGPSSTIVLVIIGVLNLSGMTHSTPPDIQCGTDCYSQIQVNSTYWEICVEHSGDQPILYKKTETSRKLWINLDKINDLVPTNPQIRVELLIPTTKSLSTVNNDKFGYLRPVKDGDCIIKRQTKTNPLGSRLVIHGSKDITQTVKWGLNVESLWLEDIKIDPIWKGVNILSTVNVDSYDYSTEKHCIVENFMEGTKSFEKETCQLIIYSSTRYVPEKIENKTVWQKIENAKDLSPYFNFVYKKDDKDNYDIKFTKYNYTYIEGSLLVKAKTTVPFKICFNETICKSYNVPFLSNSYNFIIDFNSNTTTINGVNVKFANLGGKNIFSISNWTLGTATTTLTLQDNSTENLEDTYVNAISNSANYGDSVSLNTRYTNPCISYIKWKIYPGIPNGSTINSATLFLNKSAVVAGNLGVSLADCTLQNWDEHDYTYDNRATIDNTCNATAEWTQYVNTTDNTWNNWTATVTIQKYYNGGFGNATIKLWAATVGEVYYNSGDSTEGTSNKPYLVIDYTGVSCVCGCYSSGTLYLNANSSSLCGENTFNYVIVTNNSAINIPTKNATAGTGWLSVNLIGNLTVDSTSVINGKGNGCLGATTSGGTGSCTSGGTGGSDGTGIGGGGAGGANGGNGGNGGQAPAGGAGGTGGTAYATDYTNVNTSYGSGGGAGAPGNDGVGWGVGGNGGALLKVTCLNSDCKIKMSGAINVTGSTGLGGLDANDGSGGGGAGGGILLRSNTIDITSSKFLAGGGNGACGAGSGGGGGGGGGSIKLYYDTLTGNSSSTYNLSSGVCTGVGCTCPANCGATCLGDLYFTDIGDVYPRFSANITIPDSPTPYSVNKVYKFEIVVDGISNGTVLHESNYTGSYANYSDDTSRQVLNDTSIFSFNITDSSAKTIRFRWYANETFLDITNENSTGWLLYTIIPTPTSIKLYVNKSSSTSQNYVMNDLINITTILNITDQVCLTVNKTGFGVICGTPSIINYTTVSWAYAAYNITANFTGSANKSSSVSTIYINVRNYSLDCSKAYPEYVILPTNATEFNITPYGQSTSVPFFNCTNRGNQTIKVNVSVNTTPTSCVTMWAANSSQVYNRYNMTALEVLPNISQNKYAGIWLRENYNDCNATAIGAYRTFGINLVGWSESL